MEHSPQRRKKNSPKVNLTFSLVFHGLIVGLILFWAAHEGVLGKKLKEITVAIVPKEKKPEPEKPPPKIEPPKEEPKVQDLPKVAPVAPVQTAAAPPPAAVAPAVAPPPAEMPAFNFSDGAKVVETSTNAPLLYYKSLMEYALRSNWERPADLADDTFMAEVEVSVDPSGRITGVDWKKGSGNAQWDDSVKRAIAATKTVNRPPPKDFPGKVLVRFDVLPATEPVLLQ
ncbi:MAG TPA: TonB family protein [Verrucomicrobiae bacterium]|nr:TonB family protein [Verrucomicrobiae bacterium]